MTQPAQLLDRDVREIFVGVKQHPLSLRQALFALLILTNSAVDFVGISRREFPCGVQVRWLQRRVGAENVGSASGKPAVVLKNPNGNSRITDASFSSATVGCLGNPARV
jgi:hypothetical protein